MDEKETTEEGEKEESAKTEDAGSQYETTPVIERAREEREKLELANKKTEELLDRQERIMAKRELGGMSEAGQAPEKPKKMTDTEYAEALERGEVNPLKEDGLI